LGAPAKVLDQLNAAASGEPLPHKTLLPFVPDPSGEPQHIGSFNDVDSIWCDAPVGECPACEAIRKRISEPADPWKQTAREWVIATYGVDDYFESEINTLALLLQTVAREQAEKDARLIEKLMEHSPRYDRELLAAAIRERRG
jgi:hypothetical protein